MHLDCVAPNKDPWHRNPIPFSKSPPIMRASFKMAASLFQIPHLFHAKGLKKLVNT